MKTKSNEVKNDAWLGEIANEYAFKAWIQSIAVGEYQNTRLMVCVKCDWNATKWQNKLNGKVKFTRLEKVAINEIAGKKVFNV
jgi:hypothetical protein